MNRNVFFVAIIASSVILLIFNFANMIIFATQKQLYIDEVINVKWQNVSFEPIFPFNNTYFISIMLKRNGIILHSDIKIGKEFRTELPKIDIESGQTLSIYWNLISGKEGKIFNIGININDDLSIKLKTFDNQYKTFGLNYQSLDSDKAFYQTLENTWTNPHPNGLLIFEKRIFTNRRKIYYYGAIIYIFAVKYSLLIYFTVITFCIYTRDRFN